MQLPITIGLHRSRFLDAGLVALLCSAGALTAIWPQTMPYRLIVFLAIAVTGLVAWRQLTPAVAAIRLENDGRMSVMPACATDFLSAEPLPGAFAHPLLCVIRLKLPDGRVQTVNATVGTLNRQDFRRLRVFLRWHAKFNEPAGDV